MNLIDFATMKQDELRRRSHAFSTMDPNRVLEMVKQKTEHAQLMDSLATFGIKEPILTGSGNHALETILTAMHLKPSDEVIVPAYTCKTITQIISQHAKVVFSDNGKDLNIADNWTNQITRRTKAVIGIHQYGKPLDRTFFKRAQKEKILVIEDACHALGASIGNKPVGGFGDVSFFSFRKSTSLGLGGFIQVNREDLMEPIQKEASLFNSKPDASMERNLHLALRFKKHVNNPRGYYFFGKSGNTKSTFYDRIPSQLQQAVLTVEIASLKNRIQERRKKAQQWVKKWKTFELGTIENHSLMRLPFWVKEAKSSATVLEKQGFEVGSNYQPDYEWLQQEFNLPTTPTIRLIQPHCLAIGLDNIQEKDFELLEPHLQLKV